MLMAWALWKKVAQSKQEMTVTESSEKRQHYTYDNHRAREIYRHIGEMITADNEPFTLEGHVGFTRLIN